MKTHLFEATQSIARGANWGKFLVGEFDTEWAATSALDDRHPLLAGRGWARDHKLVVDLQTGEGAVFSVWQGGYAKADLEKHEIWVCPMFEPFLAWLYEHADTPLGELDRIVELPDAPFEMAGYRREGQRPMSDGEKSIIGAAINLADICGEALAVEGGTFTCGEADAIAALLTAVGHDDEAARFLASHKEGDEEGDRHLLGHCRQPGCGDDADRLVNGTPLCGAHGLEYEAHLEAEAESSVS